MIKNIILIAQVIVSVGLVATILLQQKGSGVGGVFGGESTAYRSKRGVEKMLHYSSIVFAVLLGLISLSSVFISLKFS